MDESSARLAMMEVELAAGRATTAAAVPELKVKRVKKKMKYRGGKSKKEKATAK